PRPRPPGAAGAGRAVGEPRPADVRLRAEGRAALLGGARGHRARRGRVAAGARTPRLADPRLPAVDRVGRRRGRPAAARAHARARPRPADPPALGVCARARVAGGPDGAARLAQVVGGRADLADHVPFDSLESLRARTDVRAIERPGLTVMLLVLRVD